MVESVKKITQQKTHPSFDDLPISSPSYIGCIFGFWAKLPTQHLVIIPTPANMTQINRTRGCRERWRRGMADGRKSVVWLENVEISEALFAFEKS